MKPYLLLAIIACLFFQNSNSKEYEITFKQEDFKLVTEHNGLSYICGGFISQTAAENSPCLPVIYKNIALPYGSKIASYTFDMSSPILFAKDIGLTETPNVISLEESFNETINYSQYKSKDEEIVPNVSYNGMNYYQGFYLANFEFCPFIYNSEANELYYVDKIKLILELEEDVHLSKNTVPINDVIPIVKLMVANPDEINDYASLIPSQSYYYKEKIEYLIITSNDFEPSFHKLLDWKRTKGVFSGIITIEEINLRYEGDDLAEKIKRCIYNAYVCYGLKYVVLGGDDNIVPTRGCYGYVKASPVPIIDKSIPCDKYYGCFDGNFKWNANENDIFGEVEDEVDFTESVYVSRIPVGSVDEADGYISKLINYESGNDSKRWNKSILTVGVKRWVTDDFSRSDSECAGDIEYKKYIEPYWNGERYRFYDTDTSFIGGSSYDVTVSNLKDQLESNRMFMSMCSHGEVNTWFLEKGPYFNDSDAFGIQNASIPVISTTACKTNAFDHVKYTSLSEAFLRNPNNAVVTYIGCSRQGFGYPSCYAIGPSEIYEGEFFKYLFNPNIENKNLGRSMWLAKLSQISLCQNDGANRWIQMGLNLMGDAEMPVFTEIPYSFKPNILYSAENNSITIDANSHRCRISIISLKDGGQSYHNVYNNVHSVSLTQIPTDFVVCISKQNFVPYFYMVKNENGTILAGQCEYHKTGCEFVCDSKINAQNRTIDQIGVKDSMLTLTCTDIGPYSESSIQIKDVMGRMNKIFPIQDSKVCIDLESEMSGVYIVSLISNGFVEDSKKIVL